MLIPYPVVVSVASGGSNWTDIATAIGTVGAVIAAVGIALWADRKSGLRVKEERTRSGQLLTEQRNLDKAAIEDERAHGRAQLEEERRLALEREQLAEAYRIQVVLGQQDGEVKRDELYEEPLGPAGTKRLAVMVVNQGSYTITRLEAQFCLGSSMITPHRYQRMSGFVQVPDRLRAGFRSSPEPAMSGVLTPFDEGIRFETDEIHERDLSGPYPVVRWTDQWGTRWEHKRGVVRRIRDDQPWEP